MKVDRMWTSAPGERQDLALWSGMGPVAQLVFKTSRLRNPWNRLEPAGAGLSRSLSVAAEGVEPAGTGWNPLGMWTKSGHGSGR